MSEWKETRLKDGQRYVGLTATSRLVQPALIVYHLRNTDFFCSGIYSCTSNGALRVTKPNGDDTPAFELATLPMRLTEWRLASNAETFAYVGDEVEASVWNAERAFANASTSWQSVSTAGDTTKKRKLSEQLLPEEIWRAKNVRILI